MKPNIVLSDEAVVRLQNVMEIRGFESLEFTIEFVIAESERKALLVKKLYTNPLSDEAWAANAQYSEDELDTLNTMAAEPLHHDAD